LHLWPDPKTIFFCEKDCLCLPHVHPAANIALIGLSDSAHDEIIILKDEKKKWKVQTGEFIMS